MISYFSFMKHQFFLKRLGCLFIQLGKHFSFFFWIFNSFRAFRYCFLNNTNGFFNGIDAFFIIFFFLLKLFLEFIFILATIFIFEIIAYWRIESLNASWRITPIYIIILLMRWHQNSNLRESHLVKERISRLRIFFQWLKIDEIYSHRYFNLGINIHLSNVKMEPISNGAFCFSVFR